MEYIGQRMICDTRGADGNVHFEKDHLIFMARDSRLDSYNFCVYYHEIDRIEHYSGIKKTVVLVLKDGTRRYFYLYRSGTFMELVKAGMKANEPIKEYDATTKEVKEEAKEEKKTPISDQDLSKLERLGELHKNGVLSEDEFNAQKEAILAKYR